MLNNVMAMEVQTVKINELATRSLNSSDYFIKGEGSHMYKNTLASLANFIGSVGVLGYRGALAISDTPNEDGFYFASESGTYTNAGGLVVDLYEGINIISVTDSQTVFDKVVIPVDFTGQLDSIRTDSIFQKVNNSSLLDIRDLVLLNTSDNKTYGVKRAGNWFDEGDSRYETLLEIYDITTDEVVCRFIHGYDNSNEQFELTGVQTVLLSEFNSSGISGSVKINWDALSGNFETFNYPIKKNYQKHKENVFKTDSVKTLIGIEEVFIDNEYYLSENLYLTAFGNGTNLIIRIETEPNLPEYNVVSFLRINNQPTPRTGRELIKIPSYKNSGLNVKLLVDWDLMKGVALNNNGLTDYKLNPVLINAGSELRNNQWYGKKIVGIGTSVMFGRRTDPKVSYMVEAQKVLGFNYTNTSVPGLAIHAVDDGQGGITQREFGSSVLSVSEYAGIGVTIASEPVPFSPNGSYNNHYISWENIFKLENQDADLYIFAVAPNNNNFDTSDWDDFNKETWSYNTGTFEDHRTTFLGALIYLFDKMYAFSSSARAVLLLDSSFAFEEGKADFEKFASEFNIPIIDLWGKSNYNPKTESVLFSEGGVNPHPSTFAHEKMGAMLVNELLLIN